MTSNPNSPLIQTQPLGPWKSRTPSTDSVLYGLGDLTKVEEIIFKDKVFQTRDGETLYSVHSEKEQLGPTLNLYLKDSSEKDVARLHLLSCNECDEHETYLQIVALSNHPVGHVKIDSISGNLNIRIQTSEDTSTYIASLPMFLHTQKSTSVEQISSSITKAENSIYITSF
ncbi:uncharacterized protein [Dendrobates tinctorius]|uniref:uncharacterized protein isoform X2 n=1 Tax=Dendrobates tinctorius TaxID=92724 RepID=UPI003CC96C53